MHQSVEFVHRLGLEFRLKATPAAVPLIIQTDEQPKVELRIRLTGTSQCRNSPAGVARLTPRRGHPVDGNALNLRVVRGHIDVRFGDCLGEQLLQRPWIMRVLASEYSY